MRRNFIPVARPILAANEKKYVNECLDDVWISSTGGYIGEFEQGFAHFCGAAEAISGWGGAYPVAESCSRRGINLPTHGLLTEEDVAYIADTLVHVWGRAQNQTVNSR